MANIADSSGNRLLDALLRDCPALTKHLEAVSYPMDYIVGLQDRRLAHMYFPVRGSLLSLMVVLEGGGSAEAMVRGGFVFSDRGVSGVLPGQYSNRRAEIYEKAKT